MQARLLTVLLALGMIASTNAFASRARILVMGQGDGGFFLPGDTSFFVDDARNIFYNPAYTNDFKNWGIIEKSNSPGISGEGGVVTAINSFSLGVYLNRGDALLSGEGTGLSEAANMRPIDAMLGGDTGMMKWGIGLNYGNNDEGEGAGVSQSLLISAGLEVMDFEPFGWYRAIGNDYGATAGNTTEAHDKSWGIGTRYKMGEWTPWAGYRHDNNAIVGSDDYARYTAWTVGLGRNTKIAEGARMAYSVAFVHASGFNTPANSTTNANVVPLDIAVEGDATSWLTVRAGLGFNWWDRTDDITFTDNTSARMGATMHLGKADFEFAVGRNANLASTQEKPGAQPPGATGASGNSNNGGSLLDAQTFDIASGFFAAADIQYHW